MGNFNRNDRSGGRGGRDRRSQMHKAVCADCGKNCEVPFKPTGDKPIYCSSCFESKGGGGSRRPGGRSDRKMYKAICDDCGKQCEVPFKPTGDKSVYCSSCFGKGRSDRSSDQTARQFEKINTKLDRILEALSPAIPLKTKKEKEIAPKKKVFKEKAVVKKKKVAKPKKAVKSKVKKATSPKKAKTKKKK